MTGIMRPILKLLNPDDRRFYKSHSCGVCLAARQRYGRRATLGHCSELVFASILLEGLAAAPFRSGWGRCPVLPVLPRRLLVGPRRQRLAIASAVLAALQLDLKDAREDNERRIKRLFCLPYGGLRGEIDLSLAASTSPVDQVRRQSPRDVASETVGHVFSSLFQLAGHDHELAAIGWRVGFILGQLMTISDALDDYQEDLRTGKPNVLRQGTQPPNEAAVAYELRFLLVGLTDLVDGLQLRRNSRFLHTLLVVHTRTRIEASLKRYYDLAARESEAGLTARISNWIECRIWPDSYSNNEPTAKQEHEDEHQLQL